VIVTGPREALGPWRDVLDAAYLPTTLVLFLPSEAGAPPAAIAKPPTAVPSAWVCEGATCLAPIEATDRLREALALPKMRAATQALIPHRSLT
jgi:uncharacterized protein YyaL (SSP411 family)